MNVSLQKLIPKLELVFLALCAIWVLGYGYTLASFALGHALPFDADEAHHAARALDLYHALKNLDLWRSWEAIRDQSFYPPLHSLAVTISYFVLGVSESSSRLPTWVILYFTLALVLVALAKTISQLSDATPKSQSGIGYILGCTLLTAFFSPIVLQNASLCMLELPSACLTALVLCYFSVRRDPFSSGAYLILGLLLFLAALTKYTLIGCVAAPAILSMIRFEHQSNNILATARALFTPSILVGAIFGFLFSIWLIVGRADGVAFFLFGFPKRGMRISLENFLSYPEAFLERATLHPVLALLLVCLALLSVREIKHSRAVLFAWLCVAIGLLLLSISRQQGPRYMIQLLPCVWFLSGVGLYNLALALKRRYAALITTVLAFAVFGAFAAGSLAKLTNFKLDTVRFMETNESSIKMIELVLQHADTNAPILLFGSSDRLNADALRWSLAKAHQLAYREIELYEFPLGKELFLKTWYAQPWRRPLERYRESIGEELGLVAKRFEIKTLIIYGIKTRFKKRLESSQVQTLITQHPMWQYSDGESSIAIIRLDQSLDRPGQNAALK